MDDGLLIADPHLGTSVEMQNSNFGRRIQKKGKGEKRKGKRRFIAVTLKRISD